ncbi:hypothetical protein CAEBREN_04058 [Caenorhabditis brenneri]|uniref:Riboflavin transporter n=1 Tax=Caenorhabditis brenneri TaxID=135651 RepID=G0MTJ8_CAEBE|nr:hypothetical protein CAEBREN_04058 [Caenorhabditis brenneri]
MAKFHPAFLNAYFVGMGLSALIPSLLSLIQGTSNYWCDVIKCLQKVLIIELDPWEVKHNQRKRSDYKWNEGNPKIFSFQGSIPSSSVPESASGAKLAFLLLATALVNAQMNGIVTSVQSYATLVYSQDTYHYAVTLSNVVSPLGSYLQFFVKIRSIPILAVLTLCSSIATAIIIYLAALSPNWIFASQAAGSAISIASSLIAAALHSYLRVMFAALLREGNHKESRLFWCGAFIQIGSFIGSAIMFPLINVWKLFHSAPSCR